MEMIVNVCTGFLIAVNLVTIGMLLAGMIRGGL